MKAIEVMSELWLNYIAYHHWWACPFIQSMDEEYKQREKNLLHITLAHLFRAFYEYDELAPAGRIFSSLFDQMRSDTLTMTTQKQQHWK